MSTLTHVVGYNTHLSVRTILLLVTAELAGAVLSVAPLVHPRAVLYILRNICNNDGAALTSGMAQPSDWIFRGRGGDDKQEAKQENNWMIFSTY